MKKLSIIIALALGLIGNVFAAAPDFTTLTAGVDFSTVITGILAVSALLAVVLVVRKGAKLVLGAIK